MFTADGVEVLPPKRGHGGARPNAGAKPKGYVKPPETVDYDKARARNEEAKAQLNELELKVKSGQYLPRAMVVELVATAYATITQTLRMIPDNLERTNGISPELCDTIGMRIDDALADLAKQFQMLSGDE